MFHNPALKLIDEYHEGNKVMSPWPLWAQRSMATTPLLAKGNTMRLYSGAQLGTREALMPTEVWHPPASPRDSSTAQPGGIVRRPNPAVHRYMSLQYRLGVSRRTGSSGVALSRQSSAI